MLLKLFRPFICLLLLTAISAASVDFLLESGKLDFEKEYSASKEDNSKEKDEKKNTGDWLSFSTFTEQSPASATRFENEHEAQLIPHTVHEVPTPPPDRA